MFSRLALLTVCVFSLTAAAVEPVPYKVPAQLPDVAECPLPDQVQLQGFLGQRVLANEKGRLLVVNEDELLGGFRKRPGVQDWIGEHVGKFLHAATLAWVNTGDPALRAKIDRVAAELIKCQDPDGYLGTYIPAKKWTSWDVWVHKYDLMGLLTYYQYTGDQASLAACRKIGDLLIATFPAKKSIIKAGEHVGMAATSVLEPIVLLYRFTGDQRYLDFAKYIISAYDEPGGPRVIKSLVETKSVRKTANGKAYEMMSNLVGLCELARVTGDKSLLVPAINAWEDVVAHQLYITGASSHGEHFGNDNELPNGSRSNVGETCVTTTWIQLNAQLLRLTGQARYGDEMERAYLNHLAGAQLPDGSKWCYYTPLVGTKPYGNSVNCCLSSGPRAMAMAPQLAYLKGRSAGGDELLVNLIDASTVTLMLGGQKVAVQQPLPNLRGTRLNFTVDQPATFALKVRCAAWAEGMKLAINDQDASAAIADGWATIPARQWKSGDTVAISFRAFPRMVVGEYSNKGYSALVMGPLVLALDQAANPEIPSISRVSLSLPAEQTLAGLKAVPEKELTFSVPVQIAGDPSPRTANFTLFALAGTSGGRFQVWVRNTPLPPGASLLLGGSESRSRQGNLPGRINDLDRDAPVVTFDGKLRAEDYFAITLDAPVTIKRIVYVHGKSFHDGGWFDATAGKPQVQIQQAKGGQWETVGALDDYPASSATRNAGLQDGQEFTLRLKEPVAVWAVRVQGKPASGDNPKQAFTSCAQLQAFAD